MNTFKLEMYNGVMRETKTGYAMPELKEVITGKYRQLLKLYKAEKAEGNAVVLYRNEQIKHFKSI